MFYSERKTLSKYIKSLLNLMNFDDATAENKKEHNQNWPEV